MILIGYVLCLLGLSIACVMVKGFYLTLAVYGSVHVGCALVLLLLWHRGTHTPRQRCPPRHASAPGHDRSRARVGHRSALKLSKTAAQPPFLVV